MATANDGFYDAIDRYNVFTDNLQVIYRDLHDKISKACNMPKYNYYIRGINSRGAMPRIGDYLTLGLSKDDGFSAINITMILNKNILNNPVIQAIPSLIVSKAICKNAVKSLNQYDSSIIEVIEGNPAVTSRKLGDKTIFTSELRREESTIRIDFFQVPLETYNDQSLEEANLGIISVLSAMS
jgi:hypothetical protein